MNEISNVRIWFLFTKSLHCCTTDHLDTSGQSCHPGTNTQVMVVTASNTAVVHSQGQLHINQAPPANTGSMNVSTVVTRSLRRSSWDSPCACVYLYVCVCCEQACVACALDEAVCPTDNPVPPLRYGRTLPPASWPAGGGGGGGATRPG